MPYLPHCFVSPLPFPTKAQTITNEHLHKFHPRIEQSFVRVEAGADAVVGRRLALLMEAILSVSLAPTAPVVGEVVSVAIENGELWPWDCVH